MKNKKIIICLVLVLMLAPFLGIYFFFINKPGNSSIAVAQAQNTSSSVGSLSLQHFTSSPSQIQEESSQPVSIQPVVSEVKNTPSFHNKLIEIKFPELNFDNVSLPQIVDFLREESRKLDATGEGVDIVIDESVAAGTLPNITMSFKDVSLESVLKMIAATTGLDFETTDAKVLILVRKADK